MQQLSQVRRQDARYPLDGLVYHFRVGEQGHELITAARARMDRGRPLKDPAQAADAQDHLQEDDAHGPHIGSCRVVARTPVGGHRLGRDKRHGPARRVQESARGLCATEIDDLQALSTATDHNILRLKITMRHTSAMAMRDCPR
mmetsp:Transcript_93071/g.258727  ORF Transcript_93071/g.258727 Transcript_93071/m.258727 type:complete len:144 (-) Transcript_93071:28-459(-)